MERRNIKGINSVYNDLYTARWTEEQRQFIADNLLYLRLNGNGRDILHSIISNRFRVEHGVSLEDAPDYKLYLSNRSCKNVKIADSRADWAEVNRGLERFLSERKITLDDLRMYQHYMSFHWYCVRDIERKGQRLAFHCGDAYGFSYVFHLIRWCVKDIHCENLKEVHDELGTRRRFCEADEMEAWGLKIKTFKNGRTQIDGFTDEAWGRLRGYLALSKKVLGE